jgi:hypothetical protein
LHFGHARISNNSWLIGMDLASVLNNNRKSPAEPVQLLDRIE